MIQLLLFDINYTKDVNRVPIIIKVKNWQKANIKVTVFTNLDGENYYKSHMKDVKFVVIPFRYAIKTYYDIPFQYLLSNFVSLRHIVKIKNKFDVIYSQSSWIDFLVIPYCLKLFDKGIRWFVMVDNIVPPPHKRPGPFLQKLIPYIAFHVGNQLLKKADGILVVTNLLKKYYEKKGLPVVKIGNGYGVDISHFTKNIPFNTPKFNAVYCGRLHPAKGIFDLLSVVQEITKVDKKFTLGILGDGEINTKTNFIKMIKKFKLEKNIILLGYQEGKKKIDIIRSCDFFLFLSYDEGCPQVVIEAFAANKPVIAYSLPTYKDVFIKYIQVGQMKIFPFRNFHTIAQYIVKKEYKRKKYSNSLVDFSWDTIIKNEVKLFVPRTV